jgi:hypothetical protein
MNVLPALATVSEKSRFEGTAVTSVHVPTLDGFVPFPALPTGSMVTKLVI